MLPIKSESPSGQPTSSLLHDAPPPNLPEPLIPLPESFLAPSHESRNQCSPPRESPSPRVFLTKPRDVPVLDLHNLQGVDATARLQMFFELVEQCSDSDAVRVQIAKSRLSSNLAILVHSNQANKKISSWVSFKEYFKAEFAVDISLDRAWQELDAMQYDWEEPPQAFAHRFICQYAAVETKFPKEKFPERDQSIKRKIHRGMPSEARNRLDAFLGSDYPLNKFMDRVEHVRAGLEDQFVHIHTVPRDKAATPPHQSTEANPKTPDLTQEVEALRRELAELKAERAPRDEGRDRRPPYCSFCRSQTHDLRECRSKPARGVCFDCYRPHCRRGDPECPGRNRFPPQNQALTPPRNRYSPA